jgi:hypothetical protein
MPEPIPNPDKLLIEVHDGRWDAYGDPTNVTAALLMKTLNDMGGINHTVPNGYYHFGAEMRMGLLAVTLEPYEES